MPVFNWWKTFGESEYGIKFNEYMDAGNFDSATEVLVTSNTDDEVPLEKLVSKLSYKNIGSAATLLKSKLRDKCIQFGIGSRVVAGMPDGVKEAESIATLCKELDFAAKFKVDIVMSVIDNYSPSPQLVTLVYTLLKSLPKDSKKNIKLNKYLHCILDLEKSLMCHVMQCIGANATLQNVSSLETVLPRIIAKCGESATFHISISPKLQLFSCTHTEHSSKVVVTVPKFKFEGGDVMTTILSLLDAFELHAGKCLDILSDAGLPSARIAACWPGLRPGMCGVLTKATIRKLASSDWLLGDETVSEGSIWTLMQAHNCDHIVPIVIEELSASLSSAASGPYSEILIALYFYYFELGSKASMSSFLKNEAFLVVLSRLEKEVNTSTSWARIFKMLFGFCGNPIVRTSNFEKFPTLFLIVSKDETIQYQSQILRMLLESTVRNGDESYLKMTVVALLCHLEGSTETVFIETMRSFEATLDKLRSENDPASQRAHYKLQLLLSLEGQILKSFCAIKIQSSAVLESMVTIYQSITKGNADSRRQVHDLVDSHKFITYLIGHATCDKDAVTCFNLLQLNGEDCIQPDLIPLLLVTSPAEFHEILFAKLAALVEKSRLCCFQLGSSKAFTSLLSSFTSGNSSQNLFRCLYFTMKEYVTMANAKFLLLQVMKANADRSLLSSRVLSLIKMSIMPEPTAAPKNLLTLLPDSGTSGLKIRLPKVFEGGFQLKFQFYIEKLLRFVLIEMKGVESTRKDFSTLSIVFDSSKVALQTDDRKVDAKATKIAIGWNSVSVSIVPSKLMAGGTVAFSLNQEIIFDVQLPITMSNIQLLLGNTFNGFVASGSRAALYASISPLQVTSLPEEADYCKIIPKPFGDQKCVIVSSVKGTKVYVVGALSSERIPLVERAQSLGFVQVIFYPLLSLLSNSKLPFNSDHLASDQESFQVEGLEDTIRILSYLVINKPQLRPEILLSGFLPFFSLFLVKHVRFVTEKLAEQVVELIADLMVSGDVFEVAVTSILFNQQFISGLTEGSLLSFLGRFIDMSSKVALRGRLRACGLFRYLSSVLPLFAEESQVDVREMLFRLVDLQLADKLSAEEIRDLVVFFSSMTRINKIVSLELADLCATCLDKKLLIDSFSSTDIEAVFVGMLDRSEEEVRVAGLRLFIQLVGQTKTSDRPLTFLATKLRKFGMDNMLYSTIKDACSKLPGGKRKRWLLNWPNLIPPTLCLAEDADPVIRGEILSDLINTLRIDSTFAWASIIKLPCWYVYICDLMFNDEAEQDMDAMSEPLIFVFSRALRSCTFYEKELRQTMAYLTLRRKPLVKAQFAVRLLRDAKAYDPTASLMTSNAFVLLSVIEEYLIADSQTALLAREYLEVGTLIQFMPRFIKETGYSSSTTIFLQVCLRCPQLSIDESVVFAALSKMVGMARKQFQAAPDWLSVSAKYRLLALSSAYVLAVSRSYKSLEKLCKEHSNATGTKERVTESYLSSGAPKFMSNCATAYESLPAVPEYDDGKAIGDLHTQISQANLDKDVVIKTYNDYVNGLELSSSKSYFGVSKAGEEYWAEFLKRSTESIWRASQPAVKFLRQLPKEQTRLRSFKLTRDPKGKDHSDVSSRTDIRTDGARLVPHLANTIDVVEELEEVEETPSEDSDEDLQDDSSSFPCELIQYIHYYSADIRVTEKKIEINPTEENASYNQTVSKAAQKYVVKPSKLVWPFASLSCVVVGRRFRMRRTAIELRFSDLSVVMLNFTHDTYRAVVARFKRLGSKIEDPEKPTQQVARRRMTERWRMGEISNFDYLMELNYWAGRSVQDMSQYPVFPWIVSDYSSKDLDLSNPATFRDLRNPIGWTGTDSRAEELQMRFTEMQCHYFQHYSSPAVVLYYLLRLEPYTTMHIIFQGGRFDHADRLFYSVSSAWAGVKQNLQDVKELIPEFYYLPEAFQNHNGVHLGCRQDGSMINFLDLPPWANASPYEFVYKLRMALESDIVSASLHHWIDLIFGYKQRGAEAVKAKNVFHPDTYEPKLSRKPVEIEVEVINSVDTVGQVPMQLFKKNHPERQIDLPTSNWAELNATYLTVVSNEPTPSSVNALYLLDSALYVLRDDGRVFSYPTESSPLLGKPSRRFRPQTKSFEVFQDENFSLPAIDGVTVQTPGAMAVLPYGNSAYIIQGGMYDNTIALRCLAPERVPETDRATRFLAAHSDVVTKVVVAEDGCTVVTVGRDDTILVWSVEEQVLLKLKFSIKCHADEVLDVACSTTMDLVASSSANGSLLVHSISTGDLEWSDSHSQLGKFDIVRVSPSCYVPHLLVHSRKDSATRQYSINGVLLRVLTHDRTIINIFPLAGSSQTTVFSCAGKVVIHHSFLFDTLLAHDVEEDVVSVASHPRNPQMLLLGTLQGSVSLLRAEVMDSPRK